MISCLEEISPINGEAKWDGTKKGCLDKSRYKL